ncbi:MAG: hypothetical protein RLP09_32400 [Sandaracinaceae bacterium]
MKELSEILILLQRAAALRPSEQILVVNMTPELAEALLAFNTANRPCSTARVDGYARQMLVPGRWRFNGATICLSRTGRLIDGQGRLRAIVKAGVTVRMIVVTGLDDDVFPTIDRQKKRSPGDALAIDGEKNSRALASALAIISAYEQNTHGGGWRGLEPEDALYMLDRHPEARVSTAQVCSVPGDNSFRIAAFIASHYIFSRIDRDGADAFVSDVKSGANLQHGDPVGLLRDAILKSSASKSRMKRSYKLGLIIKAWNYRRRNKIIRFLRIRERNGKEEFPVVEGMEPEQLTALGDEQLRRS